MKKIIPWITAVSLAIFVIAWGIMGLKIFDGNYNFTLEAYIGLAAIIVFFVFILIKKFSSEKCPYCGKIRLDNGKYCSYCGKEIEL